MSSHVLRRASTRTRTFAFAVALALAASMLATSPAAGSSSIERTDSLDVGVTDGFSQGGFALSDGTHAYFGYHSGAVGRIEKVHINTLQRVEVSTAQNFTVNSNDGWTAAAIHGSHLYLAAGDDDRGIIRKVNKDTLELAGPEIDLSQVVTNNNANFPFGRPLAVHIDAQGFGYFVANARTLQRIGVFKLQLSDASDMEVVAFGLLEAAPIRERIFSAAGGGEAGVFDATHGYLVTGNNSSAATGVSKFALADITNTDLTTIHATGTTVTTTSVDLQQSGHLSATERVCALVADDDHLYAASCIIGQAQPGGAGRVTKVNKGAPTDPPALVSTTEIATPSNISSAVIDGADAYFIGARVTKVATGTMAVGPTTNLCSGENVRASVLVPGGDLLLNVRVSTGAIARVVRVGAGSRSGCPGGSVNTNIGGGGVVTSGGDVPAPVSAAVAAASAAGVAGSSSAVLVRGGEVVPVTSSSVAGAGPRGGVVLETEGLKVTLAAAGGASPQTGVIAPVGGEIVCEVCAELAAGSTVEAWMYSTPQLTAAAQVSDDHEDGDCVLLRIPTGAPLTGEPIEAGAHTLQLRLTTVDGLEVLATGVTVGTAVPSSVPAGDGPAGGGLLGVFGLLAAAAAVAVRRLAVAG